MRAIGMAERGVVRDLIADARIDIDQARLLVHKTAWLIDRFGAKGARTETAAIKVAAPALALRVIDRAIEAFGAAGESDDFPLAYSHAWGRCLRIVDGPDGADSPLSHRRSSGTGRVCRSRMPGTCS